MRGSVINDLERIIGLDALVKLAGAHGGTRVVIPKTPSDDHHLVQLLGVDAAKRLCAWTGGEYFEVPRCVHLETERLHADIRQDRAAGMSIRNLALKHRRTERGIRLVLNGR